VLLIYHEIIIWTTSMTMHKLSTTGVHKLFKPTVKHDDYRFNVVDNVIHIKEFMRKLSKCFSIWYIFRY